MIADDIKVCLRCERDVTGETTFSCRTCKVFDFCLDCGAKHGFTCIETIRMPEPEGPPAAVPAPSRGSAIDSPALWIIAAAAAFAALLARVMA